MHHILQNLLLKTDDRLVACLTEEKSAHENKELQILTC